MRIYLGAVDDIEILSFGNCWFTTADNEKLVAAKDDLIQAGVVKLEDWDEFLDMCSTPINDDDDDWQILGGYLDDIHVIIISDCPLRTKWLLQRAAYIASIWSVSIKQSFNVGKCITIEATISMFGQEVTLAEGLDMLGEHFGQDENEKYTTRQDEQKRRNNVISKLPSGLMHRAQVAATGSNTTRYGCVTDGDRMDHKEISYLRRDFFQAIKSRPIGKYAKNLYCYSTLLALFFNFTCDPGASFQYSQLLQFWRFLPRDPRVAQMVRDIYFDRNQDPEGTDVCANEYYISYAFNLMESIGAVWDGPNAIKIGVEEFQKVNYKDQKTKMTHMVRECIKNINACLPLDPLRKQCSNAILKVRDNYEGLKKGIDCTNARTVMKKLRPKELSAFLMVVGDALWVRERCYRHLQTSPMRPADDECTHCKNLQENGIHHVPPPDIIQDQEHIFWDCRKYDDIRRKYNLAGFAHKISMDSICTWRCGIPVNNELSEDEVHRMQKAMVEIWLKYCDDADYGDEPKPDKPKDSNGRPDNDMPQNDGHRCFLDFERDDEEYQKVDVIDDQDFDEGDNSLLVRSISKVQRVGEDGNWAPTWTALPTHGRPDFSEAVQTITDEDAAEHLGEQDHMFVKGSGWFPSGCLQCGVMHPANWRIPFRFCNNLPVTKSLKKCIQQIKECSLQKFVEVYDTIMGEQGMQSTAHLFHYYKSYTGVPMVLCRHCFCWYTRSMLESADETMVEHMILKCNAFPKQRAHYRRAGDAFQLMMEAWYDWSNRISVFFQQRWRKLSWQQRERYIVNRVTGQPEVQIAEPHIAPRKPRYEVEETFSQVTVRKAQDAFLNGFSEDVCHRCKIHENVWKGIPSVGRRIREEGYKKPTLFKCSGKPRSIKLVEHRIPDKDGLSLCDHLHWDHEHSITIWYYKGKRYRDQCSAFEQETRRFQERRFHTEEARDAARIAIQAELEVMEMEENLAAVRKFTRARTAEYVLAEYINLKNEERALEDDPQVCIPCTQ